MDYTDEELVDTVIMPSVTEKYIYLACEKLGGKDVSKLSSTEVDDSWLTFAPAVDEQLVVAFVREGKEDVKEEQREGTISFEEFQFLQRQVRSLLDKDTKGDKKDAGF